METDEVGRLVKDVDGWFTDKEGMLLYNLAKRCTGRGVIVEIGSWKGKSTIWLAQGSKAGKKVKVYAIDPHIGSPPLKPNGEEIWTFDEFKRNITAAGADDIISPIVKTSEEAVREVTEPVELIFIDGDHTYEGVKKDFELWYPKVVPGGFMVFHDSIILPGPKRVVGEHLFKSKNFKDVSFVKATTFGEKTQENTPPNRLRNRCMLLCKDIYEIVCITKITLVKLLKRLK